MDAGAADVWQSVIAFGKPPEGPTNSFRFQPLESGNNTCLYGPVPLLKLTHVSPFPLLPPPIPLNLQFPTTLAGPPFRPRQ